MLMCLGVGLSNSRVCMVCVHGTKTGAWACAATKLICHNVVNDGPADVFADTVTMWCAWEDLLFISHAYAHCFHNVPAYLNIQTYARRTVVP